MTTIPALSRRHRTVIADQVSYLVKRLATLMREWRRRSRSRSDLRKLNDRELWDISLSRADAAHEANKSFWQE